MKKETLEKLLVWGQRKERECINILKVPPPELLEYNEVIEKVGKLRDVLE